MTVGAEVPGAAPSLRFTRNRWRDGLAASGVFAAVAALFLLGMLLSPGFATTTNQLNTLRAVALLGIVASGLAFVTFSGHYADLSVPSIMAFAGTIAISAQPLGPVLSLVAGLVAGTMLGVLNGVVIGYLRVNPIIWTLVTASTLDGVMRWIYSGNQIYPDATTAAGRIFLGLYDQQLVGGIPLLLVVFAAAVLLGHLLLTRTSYGAQVRLVGSSPEVARFSGIDVPRVVLITFMISALAASIGGLLLTSLNKAGAPYLGKGYDFAAVTAVVIGGVTLAGGRGTIIGVLGGVLVIGLLSNIMSLIGIGTFAQVVVQGAVFIAVVGLQQWSLRRAGQDDA